MNRLLVFDLDGTLADTMEDLLTAMNAMHDALGYPPCTKQDLLAAINHGARYFVQMCLPEEVRKDDEKVEKALEVYTACYLSNYIDKTVEYPGMTKLLQKLKAEGYTLAVMSNKQDPLVKEIVRVLFGDQLFISVNGQSDLPAKPNPDCIYRIAKECELSLEKAALVGDSNVDIETALNAKILPIGVAWGYRSPEILKSVGAEHIAYSMDELYDIIKRTDI